MHTRTHHRKCCGDAWGSSEPVAFGQLHRWRTARAGPGLTGRCARGPPLPGWAGHICILPPAPRGLAFCRVHRGPESSLTPKRRGACEGGAGPALGTREAALDASAFSAGSRDSGSGALRAGAGRPSVQLGGRSRAWWTSLDRPKGVTESRSLGGPAHQDGGWGWGGFAAQEPVSRSPGR